METFIDIYKWPLVLENIQPRIEITNEKLSYENNIATVKPRMLKLEVSELMWPCNHSDFPLL